MAAPSTLMLTVQEAGAAEADLGKMKKAAAAKKRNPNKILINFINTYQCNPSTSLGQVLLVGFGASGMVKI